MSEEVIDERWPLIHEEDDDASQGSFKSKRTGNTWSAVAHIITGVIGAGVLSLAWSVAELGWIAGPLLIILFAIITIVSAFLLSDCYTFPHPFHGNYQNGNGIIRNSTYMDAVNLFLD